MAAPDLILLDEPSLGLSPKLTKEIFEIVVRINRERGTTILLVEQNANMALNAADYGYVLENGRIVMEDTLRAPAREGRHQGVLPRHEGSRRARRAALEEEEDLEMKAIIVNLWDLSTSSNPRWHQGTDRLCRRCRGRDHRLRCSGTRRSRVAREVWMRQKELGIWKQPGPGRRPAQAVREIAPRPDQRWASRRRDRVSSCPTPVVEWVLADLAVLCCGGVANGIYPTDAASQVQYLCEDSGTTSVLFVEDEEQLDKALEVREQPAASCARSSCSTWKACASLATRR